MQFSDPTNESGIVEATRDTTGTNSNSYPIEDITRNTNKYYRKAVVLIQEVDNAWVWDDKNATTLPREVANLVSGQNDYSIDKDVRDVLRVEVLDETGTVWRNLRQLDQSQIKSSIQEMFKTDSLPLFYEHIGQSLYLYPAPNYNMDSGIKIWEKRTSSEFLSADTTKEPGFDSQFHDYLVLGNSYEYFLSRTDRENDTTRLYNELKEMEKSMRRYYSRRGGMKRVGFKRNPRI